MRWRTANNNRKLRERRVGKVTLLLNIDTSPLCSALAIMATTAKSVDEAMSKLAVTQTVVMEPVKNDG